MWFFVSFFVCGTSGMISFAFFLGCFKSCVHFSREFKVKDCDFSALFFLLNIFPYSAVNQNSVIVIIPGKEDEKGWLSSSSVEEEQVHVSWNQRPTWLSSERVSWQVLGEQKVTRTDVVSDDGCGLFWSFKLQFFILHISLPKVNNTSQRNCSLLKAVATKFSQTPLHWMKQIF